MYANGTRRNRGGKHKKKAIDWADVFQIGGFLGLTEDEIWNTSPRVLMWMHQGKQEGTEAFVRTTWEAARFQAVTIANSNGAKIKSLKKLAEFPWEENISRLTNEDIERLRKLDRRFNGIK